MTLAIGMILTLGGIGLFFFIAVEGVDSWGCLILLVVPIGLTAAGIYLIATDPLIKSDVGGVLSEHKGLTLHDGQGYVVSPLEDPVRVEKGSTVSPSLTLIRGRLLAGVLERPRGAATYKGCEAAVTGERAYETMDLTDLHPGDALCMYRFPQHGDERAIALIRLTAVDLQSRSVTFDLTLWKRDTWAVPVVPI
ncbi:hypothetical protein [Nonomuraea sp. JJY05]|jgi:hypothetical protein|uniref:hypothetical protein n=1 Tax=Nonomuraea sp. JJY05 TaxID=3350255 RepID=UPI00373EF223